MSQPPHPPPYPPTPAYPAAIPYGRVESKPQVLTWFRVYAVLMALMYALLIALGVFFIVGADGIADPDMSADEARITGAILLAVGAALAGVYVVGLVLPRRPWAWIYGIVLIALGLTSCLTMAAAIPLLIFWIRPEVRAWFGRTI